MEGKSDWATPTLMEAPFWIDDMSPEEYELERAYYINISSRGIQSRIGYKPLWKQNKKVICELSNSMEVIELADKIKTMTDEELERILVNIE